MATDNLCWMPAADMAAAIRKKTLSPVEVVRALLARIERVNPALNAFVTLTAEQAMRDARAAERAVMKRGARLGPLHGVPFSTKDLVATKGIRTTFGTRLYADNVPTEDAPMVARLKAAGAIQLGKTNTPMLGWIGATHNLLFGPTRNPWNLDRTPGGSSGGASAAVAAGLGPLAIGTDGGGSIRIPAACTGIFGLKPSFGRIPVYPFSAAWSLSHVGPMTRTVKDAALMLMVSAGPDERDPSSLPLKPGWPSPLEAWEAIFCGGIAARLEPYLGDRRQDIDAGLAAIVDETRQWGPTRYVQAWFERLAWGEHPRRLFETYDLLLTPTIGCPPFEVGLDHPAEIAGKPVRRYSWVPYTPPFNLTGQPAASVPCGFTRDGLPVGLHIVGRRFDDASVLRAAAAFERIQPWSHLKPPEVAGS